MVKFTGRPDEAPLLSSSSSIVSSDDRRHNTPALSSGDHKGGFIRLFARHRPITPISKPLTTKTLKTVDTRSLVVEKESFRKTVPATKRTKNNLRPQPLQENKKDSRRKQRPRKDANKSDPAAGDLTAVISQGDSTTGCSHTVATTQSDAGGHELQTFHSLGGSTSREDHEYYSFPASFDAAKHCDEVQHLSPLSSNRSSGKQFTSGASQSSPVKAGKVQQTNSMNGSVAECHEVVISKQVSSSAGETPPSVSRALPSDCSSSTEQESTSPEKETSRNKRNIVETSSPSSLEGKPKLQMHEDDTRTPKIVATVSISPVNDTLHVPEDKSSQPDIPARTKRPLSKTKALLSRPFGRSSLPPEIIRKWVVEVSPAEWDADESEWKYRLLIQSRHVNKERKNNPVFPYQQSFTTAFTWRSIADFLWLEESLQREYQGGLLLPDLSKALRGPINGNIRETPVEAEKLRNWLSDVLNGVRGQGELLMDYEAEGILGSESMEAFLYRSSGPTSLTRSPEPKSSTLSPDETPATSFIEHLFSPNGILSPFAACAGTTSGHGDMSKSRRAGLLKQIDAISCQSSALEIDRSFDRQESFLDSDPVIRECPTFYSMFIEAEQALLRNYLATAHRTTEKLNKLIDEEEKAGYAWSVFVQSLVMLFAIEKEFESSHIADLKLKQEKIHFCQVDKDLVEESLEAFTKAKVDRVLPALNVFGAMLRAYVDDLESIDPACKAFEDARIDLMNILEAHDRPASQTWEDKIKDMASRSFGSHVAQEKQLEMQLQKEVEKNRLLKNEKLLYRSLTTFCRGVPIRSSRMAWRYLNTEATQCAAMYAASVALRKSIAVGEKAASKRVARQVQQERQDFEAELGLVMKIIDLSPQGSSSNDGKRILELAHERAGKWDLALAKVLLEKVGFTDTGMQLPELSRDLESIRKYACGLHDNLDRCIRSLHQLRKACLGGRQVNKQRGPLETARNEFFSELANLFSGTFVNVDKRYSEQRKQVLSQAGIDTSDSFQWKRLCPSSQQNGRATFTQGSAADLINAYFVERDSKIGWIFDQLAQLLQDYFKQVEVIENFVYMNYVGTELESFLKSKRAEMLFAFEKKTDVTAAINVAMKKRLPHLVSELQVKLDGFGPDVSQTKLKEMKASHLASKEIKAELHELSLRRFVRSREASTEKVISLIKFLSREVENTSTQELKALGEAMAVLERSIDKEDFDTVVYKLSKKSLKAEMT
ncbi:hypothetical protein FisN_12Lh354 [Fistulifera solaris]|uniref:PX domain-containing protein n=1 Tax=Fistulifera solaris TaxID=1519565 RepID=A0A1Z5JLQ4_FISSO|nr:hypothetical protein FisN_12Lh354 [Fistulifera solaris]|eukprot:GAX14943.1 hypothetical protein FisN_12Lh354 [Fistulifera solaris]